MYKICQKYKATLNYKLLKRKKYQKFLILRKEKGSNKVYFKLENLWN